MHVKVVHVLKSRHAAMQEWTHIHFTFIPAGFFTLQCANVQGLQMLHVLTTVK